MSHVTHIVFLLDSAVFSQYGVRVLMIEFPDLSVLLLDSTCVPRVPSSLLS